MTNQEIRDLLRQATDDIRPRGVDPAGAALAAHGSQRTRRRAFAVAGAALVTATAGALIATGTWPGGRALAPASPQETVTVGNVSVRVPTGWRVVYGSGCPVESRTVYVGHLDPATCRHSADDPWIAVDPEVGRWEGQTPTILPGGARGDAVVGPWMFGPSYVPDLSQPGTSKAVSVAMMAEGVQVTTTSRSDVVSVLELVDRVSFRPDGTVDQGIAIASGFGDLSFNGPKAPVPDESSSGHDPDYAATKDGPAVREAAAVLNALKPAKATDGPAVKKAGAVLKALNPAKGTDGCWAPYRDLVIGNPSVGLPAGMARPADPAQAAWQAKVSFRPADDLSAEPGVNLFVERDGCPFVIDPAGGAAEPTPGLADRLSAIAHQGAYSLQIPPNPQRTSSGVPR